VFGAKNGVCVRVPFKWSLPSGGRFFCVAQQRPASSLVRLLSSAALALLVAACTKTSVQSTAAAVPGPKILTLTCLRALPTFAWAHANADSISDGGTQWGVCVSGNHDARHQSWWKLDGAKWKAIGGPLPADANADQVTKMHYGVPSADVAALLDEMVKVRAAAAKNPINFGPPPTARPGKH
jgi:hypothetical protein